MADDKSKEPIKRIIETWGHVTKDSHGEPCGNCTSLETQIKEKIIPKSPIPVEFRINDIYTPESESFRQKKGFENMPFTRDCKIYKDKAEPECREVEGYKESDWKE